MPHLFSLGGIGDHSQARDSKHMHTYMMSVCELVEDPATEGAYLGSIQ